MYIYMCIHICIQRRLSLVAAVRHNDPEERSNWPRLYLRAMVEINETKTRTRDGMRCFLSRGRSQNGRIRLTCAPIRIRKPCRQRRSLIALRRLRSSLRLNAGHEACIVSPSRCFPRSWIEKETSRGTATWTEVGGKLGDSRSKTTLDFREQQL